MDINEILSLNTVNLETFEIRGAKSGFNNARTTGPLYVNGQYFPTYSNITGDGSFSSDQSTITNFTFDSPYGSLNTSSLKIGDLLTSNSLSFSITNILTTNSFQIDYAPGFTGTNPISFDMGQRDYLIEPDIITNTDTGTALFTQGDKTVIGYETTWLSDLSSTDFIKHDGYQQYYKINQVLNDTTLGLISNYLGDTTTGAYTAKRWTIGRTKIQYAKNNINYDNQSGKWKYSAIIDNDQTTSTEYSPFIDGITTAYTHSIKSTSPDLMDVAVVTDKTFARETQYDTFQFSLPVIPYPETSMSLIVGNNKLDRFPEGNQDYVMNYSQNPIYTPPPPPDQRFVANIMFLNGASNVSPDTSLTETGQIRITDSSGNDIAGIMQGSENIKLDGTTQKALKDYVLENNSGTLEIIDSTIYEPVVKYVGVNYSNFINYGFDVYLNGIKQKISFPAETDDDILFQPFSGRFKPSTQEHPAPGDIYEIHYMVESSPISDEVIYVTTGQTIVNSSLYPIKQNSILLYKNDDILDENTDYFISHLTGRITFVDSLNSKDIIVLNYTPLSKQINYLTYDEKWYCTVNDAKLNIRNSDYEFTLLNIQLNPANISIQRIYNETRDVDYNLTGLTIQSNVIKLQKNTANLTAGLSTSDIVIIDYTFASETTEYYPVVINYLNIFEGSKSIYLEGQNISSLIDNSSVINVLQPDSATQYLFTVTDSTYDGFGTLINTDTVIPEDVVNPKLYITDSSITFNTVPLISDYIISGSTTISFPGSNIRNIFRPSTILRVDKDIYQVSNAFYDNNLNKNIVSLTSEILKDATTNLNSIKYSDCPIYLEGDTEIIPFKPIITTVKQPVFIMSNNDDRILPMSSDTLQITIDNTSFSYTDSTTINNLSIAINSAIPTLSILTYTPNWQCNKIIPVTGQSIYEDSSTILYAKETLRYMDSTDSTNFSVTESGTILLTNPLKIYDRYNLDYMGREFIGDTQVNYSVKYFVSLPAKSKVSASFQYKNLDQFYIQVLDQRDFFQSVSIPRMTEESYQLNGNVGQGGEVTGDEGNSSSEGGVTGDEYRRKDTDIECRVFKNIYDFFGNRIYDFGSEMDAAVGLRLFNNDGTFSEIEQNAANKVVNRIFPNSDYTNYEPMKVNPLTGYFMDTGAVFYNGSTTVDSVGTTYWSKQLKANDFIGRQDSTKRYRIASVISDYSINLVNPFIESSTTDADGDAYTACTSYPIYDDDGHLGAKLIGTKYKKFKLNSGETFFCTLDGTSYSCTFTNPSDLFMALLYPVSRLSGDSVAEIITSSIPGLSCTLETVIDPNKPYGYKSALVLRTISPINHMILGDTTTTTKLGFVRGSESYGNLDRTDHNPEIIMDMQEAYYLGDRSDSSGLGNEIIDLYTLLLDGTSNKFNRIDSTSLLIANEVYTLAGYEKPIIATEINKLNTQINALERMIQEPTLAAYAQSLIAYNDATDALLRATTAYNYVNSINPGWEGKGQDWKWVLDFTDSTQYIGGIDSTEVAVPDPSGIGITSIKGLSTFILQAPSDNDRRILDTTSYKPVVYYENNNLPADGSWTGWDLTVDGSYSTNNEIRFYLNTSPVFYIRTDSFFTTPKTNTDSTKVNLFWTDSGGLNQNLFPYSSYPKVSDLKDGFEAISGFYVNNYYNMNYDYTNLKIDSSVSTSGGAIIYSGINSPAFSMYSTDATSPTYVVDSSAVAITDSDGTKSVFLYTNYLTLNDIENAIGTVSGMNVTGYFDSSLDSSALTPSSGTVNSSAPGTYINLSIVPLLSVIFQINNIRYSTDSSALSIKWDGVNGIDERIFSYSSYPSFPTISDMKIGINTITGIDATGLTKYDSSYCEAFRFAYSLIVSDATIYPGLRDSYAVYQTISDKILNDRSSFAVDRSSFLGGRIDYLELREVQIKGHLDSEEILRINSGDNSGNSGDLYTWANNRFNRRQGCYARLKQIEQQISSNKSALDINKQIF